jgi:hypothetical protein
MIKIGLELLLTTNSNSFAAQFGYDNIYLKILLRTKALRGNPSQTPPAKLDCEGLRQCDR